MGEDKDKQELFIEYLFMAEEDGGAGGNPHKAKHLAGYNPGYSTRALLATKSMQEAIEKATKDYFTQVAPESVMAMLSILRDPARPGSANRLNAAKELLDRGGFVKTEKMEVTTGGGLFILPAKEESDG